MSLLPPRYKQISDFLILIIFTMKWNTRNLVIHLLVAMTFCIGAGMSLTPAYTANLTELPQQLNPVWLLVAWTIITFVFHD